MLDLRPEQRPQLRPRGPLRTPAGSSVGENPLLGLQSTLLRSFARMYSLSIGSVSARWNSACLNPIICAATAAPIDLKCARGCCEPVRLFVIPECRRVSCRRHDALPRLLRASFSVLG